MRTRKIVRLKTIQYGLKLAKNDPDLDEASTCEDDLPKSRVFDIDYPGAELDARGC